MKYLLGTIFIAFILVGCTDKKFDGSVESLESIMSNMNTNEMGLFIQNLETLIFIAGGEERLVGMSLDELNTEISKIHNKNLSFLKRKLEHMSANSQEKTNILNLHGALTEPKNEQNSYRNYDPRYSGTNYTKNEIASMIGSFGNMADYEQKRRATAGFMQGCLQDSKANERLCHCVWNSIGANFSYLEISSNTLKPTVEYKTFLEESARQCFLSNKDR